MSRREGGRGMEGKEERGGAEGKEGGGRGGKGRARKREEGERGGRRERRGGAGTREKNTVCGVNTVLCKTRKLLPLRSFCTGVPVTHQRLTALSSCIISAALAVVLSTI